MFVTDTSFQGVVAQAEISSSMQEYVLKRRHVVRMKDPHVIRRWNRPTCGDEDSDQKTQPGRPSSACLGAKAARGGSKLELYLRLMGRDQDQITSAHEQKQEAINSIKGEIDSMLDVLHSQEAGPDLDLDTEPVREKLSTLIDMLHSQQQQLAGGRTSTMPSNLTARRNRENVAVVKTSLLVLASPVKALTETIRRAAFYHDCGFSVMVRHALRGCHAHTAGQWHALIDNCYGQHSRPVVRSTWLLWLTRQTSGTL